MNYDIKNGLKTLIDIQNAIEVKVQSLQLAVNEQESDAVIISNAKLTIQQANDLISFVNNYGYYTAMATVVSHKGDNETSQESIINNITNDQLIVAQSIHDYFVNNEGFYTDEYLCNVFGYPNSDVIIDLEEEKVTFNSETELHEVTMDEFLAKLAEDFKKNEDIFTDAFKKRYTQTRSILQTIAKQLASNTIDYDQVVVVNSNVSIDQMNESIVYLSNKLDDIYKQLVPDVKTTVPETEESVDFMKFIYIVVVIVGVCLVTSLLFVMFTKPALDAGIGPFVRT